MKEREREKVRERERELKRERGRKRKTERKRGKLTKEEDEARRRKVEKGVIEDVNNERNASHPV